MVLYVCIDMAKHAIMSPHGDVSVHHMAHTCARDKHTQLVVNVLFRA